MGSIIYKSGSYDLKLYQRFVASGDSSVGIPARVLDENQKLKSNPATSHVSSPKRWPLTSFQFASTFVVTLSLDCTYLLLINVHCHLGPSGMIQILTTCFWEMACGVYKGALMDGEGRVWSIFCTAEYNRKFLLTQKENLYSVLF